MARAARVSVATVSRVLNDSGPVHHDTRRRVRDAAQSLRFTPHGAARSLITSRTNTLGVLLPDLYGEFFSEIIRGLERGAQTAGYHLLLSSVRNVRDDIAGALRIMHGRVDGLIVMSPDTNIASLLAPRDEVPSVFINSALISRNAALLTIDNHDGAFRMVEHLIRAGHDRVAMIHGPDHNHDAAERARGYRAALERHGVAPQATWEIAGDFREQSGFESALALLRSRSLPTAIFCANDVMAIGAMCALRSRGVRVPDDMAVVGFDDIPLARYVDPALTTVRVPICELGARAVELLLDGLQNGALQGRPPELISTQLVIRESCGFASPRHGEADMRGTFTSPLP